jgi:hypothetical protein
MYYDSATTFMLYAWRVFYPVYSWYEAFSALQLPRSMDRTNWTGFVVSASARCSSGLLLPVGPPGKESLHGLGLSAWLKWLRQQEDICLVYIGVPGILRGSGMYYAFNLTQGAFSTFCRYFVTLRHWCVNSDKSDKYSRTTKGHLSYFID